MSTPHFKLYLDIGLQYKVELLTLFSNYTYNVSFLFMLCLVKTYKINIMNADQLCDFRADITRASERIEKYVYRTPLSYSRYLSKKTCSNVYFKLECEQLTGSFKVRGAFNKLLMAGDPKAHFVTASTGNHGMAFSQALTTLEKTGTVFVPENVASGKEASLRLFGTAIKKHGFDCVDTEKKAREYARDRNAVYVSPYADLEIIYGQGTIGKEIADALPDVDAAFVTVGGGGLVSGIGTYLKSCKREIEIVGCLPANSAVMMESVKAGRIVTMESLDTLSDASAGGVEEGSPTFELCSKLVDKWVTVSENDIASAIYMMLEHHHKVIEGSAGVAIAGFLQCAEKYKGKNVAVVLCGSNISMEKLKLIVDCNGKWS